MLDILSLNNLLNSNWGIGQSLVSSTPSYQRSPGSGDVWRMQLSFRHTFN